MHFRCCQIYSILSQSALKQEDPIAAFIKESKNSNTQKTKTKNAQGRLIHKI